MVRTRLLALLVSAVVVLPLAAVADPPVAPVHKTYTLGYAPSTLCRTDSTVGGACFDIPQDRRTFFVEAFDSRDHWAQFRVILLDRDLLPIVDMTYYGEHCARMPYALTAPPNATRLLVEIGEAPSFTASWCPHVEDSGNIWVWFQRSARA